MLGYERETYRRETAIIRPRPSEVDERGLTFKARIEPHGELVDRAPRRDLVRVMGRAGHRDEWAVEAATEHWLEGWTSGWQRRRASSATRTRCEETYQRSLVDLAALRFETRTMPGHALPAAGLPWFMTMFGRDSILTSLQSLPFTPELAETTLRALGERQGTQARRLPGRGPRPHPPRDALRRDDGVRGAAPLAVLRRCRRDSPLRRPARRVRTLDRRHQARPGSRVRGARGAELDRRVRRPAGQRLHLVPATQREDRPREPVLEGLVGLHLLPGR